MAIMIQSSGPHKEKIRKRILISAELEGNKKRLLIKVAGNY
jgi:hypothetical protein